ncbi:MAG: phage tail tube protein, partial [Candidatus Pacebacteria bacterium]|nr:phage tail tube protein [Candidatus Paceibacterota bacterium]
MIQRGEDINIGVGMENPSARGTKVTPQMWIPGRTPTGIKLNVNKATIKETRANKIASEGTEPVMKTASGDLEANIRSKSFGYLFRSLLGKCTSAAKGGESGVYEHTFEVLPSNPEHPSLTLGLSQPAIQDYSYPLAVVSEMKINTTPEDLVVATVSMLASAEEEKSPDYVVAYDADDIYFRHQDVKIYFAADVAGLATAAVTKVKSLEADIKNNAAEDQNVSELNPGNILAGLIDVTGSFEANYNSKDNHDIFDDNTYKAMRIVLERVDLTIGSASHPKIQITLPRVSFTNLTPNRPIDDIVTDSVEFQAHYDDDEAQAIEIIITN